MTRNNYSLLLCVLALNLPACSQDAEQQEAAEQEGTVQEAGTAEQVGRQIDQAVGKLQQQAKEAESRLGDRLIEAGEMLKEKPESASDAER